MSGGITIERAELADIPAIAALFTESFRASVLHHCGGRLPKPLAMEDVFTLVYEAEPAAALTAKTTDGRVVGYCFAPTALSALWIRSVAHGHLIKWLWRWLTGRYGFGLYPVKIILQNKLAFFRAAFTPGKAADARILSIAVAPEFRGRRIASRLMAAALAYFADRRVRLVRLEVRPDNAPAIAVYRKMGFTFYGTTSDSQGDWLIMLKEIEMERDYV